MGKQYKAFALLSGGLDSQLAICVLREQGVHVEAITFRSPFFGTEKGEKAAAAIGVKHHIVDFTEEILAQVQNPAHGLGKAMNPCIDCHAHMVMRAGELMEKLGFDFIATGEVLAQRPMSQNKNSLGVVARCSKYEDVLVRPLCAKLLPPTKPVREGWIDAEKLPAFSGRNRTPQIELAAKFGLKDYPAPAGGCLLTERLFGLKLKDLLMHEGPDTDRTNVWLLPVGRHFRLSENTKLIVGSDEAENERLDARANPQDLRLASPDFAGPVAIVPAAIPEALLRTAASICARYVKSPPGQPVRIQVSGGGSTRFLDVEPMAPDAVERHLITRQMEK